MNKEMVMGLVRHVLTLISGAFAAKYLIDPSLLDAAVSGITAIIGIGWSIKAKKAT
jgi:hypothetical protein